MMRFLQSLQMMMCACVFAITIGCNRTAPSIGGHGHSHGTGHSHGGGHDDHGGGGDHHAHDEPDPVTVTLFTSKVELFMEYPQLAVGEKARFLAHLSVLATGEPVRSGTMTMEASGPDGKTISLRVDAPKRDGLFIPELAFEKAGKYKTRLVLESPQVKETIDVGELVVHANEHDAIHAGEAAAEEEPANAVPFLMEQQWKIGMLLGTASKQNLVHRLALPATIVAPQGASAAISPPVAGRLLPPPGGKLPRIGDHVEAGQVLGMIEPPLAVTEVAQLSANRMWLRTLKMELGQRELELDTKGLEVERSIIQSKARLDFARSALGRATSLREQRIGTEQQHEEAVQNLRLAEAEHDGARAMKRSYEEARQRLAKLRASGVGQEDGIAVADTSYQMPLRTPIPGYVVSVNHIEGEYLDADHQEVFRVVNTDHVWVRANMSEFDLAELLEHPGATMTLLSYPDKRFDILGAAGGRLVNIGRVIDPQTRTVSVVYELPNTEGLFRVGMFADVFLETKKAMDAVVIPKDAIVMDNGRAVAFVLLDGETFQRRELDIGIEDDGFVEVKSGVEVGERLATKGAYAIKLASQSPASFGHGHVH